MGNNVTDRPLSHYLRAGIVIGALVFAWPSVLFTQDAGQEEVSEEFIRPIEAVNGGELVPELVRRPSRGEDPRYPRDAVIGELGRGSASEAAYRFARGLLAALLGGDGESAVLSSVSAGLKTEIAGTLEAIDARKYRIGGGREEDDASTSFLFRFVGREQGVAGELYLRRDGETWLVDDIIIEEPRKILDGGEAYPYDFTPYERFF
ncbi:MAG: hypothetical protein LBH57_07865 [Treponema sp.]|jgi:hypothetical protein|nr:hypothetical protein [Treponema sp.]